MVHILGGHDDFGGFFAYFFQKGVRPLVQQTRDITGLRIAAMHRLAALDDGGQASEGVLRQRSGYR